MKLLLDACVWGGTVKALADAGHDVVWAGDWHEDPGDEEILARAYAEGRVLITLDKHFGELVVMRRRPHGGIVGSSTSGRRTRHEYAFMFCEPAKMT